MIKDDEVLYYSSTIYQRTDPGFSEPPDPYHLPIMPFYTGKQVTEHWITYDILKERTEIRTGDHQVLSWEFVRTPDSVSFYDALAGVVNVSERQPPAQNQESSLALKDISWISGTRKTHWGKNAWVIKFIPEAALPTDFPLETGSLMEQRPFGNDLRFKQIQWEWEIDQQTELIVSRVLSAMTPDGSVVLYSEFRSEPDIMLRSELPVGWDQLSVSSEELAEMMRSENESEIDLSLILGNEWTPNTLSEMVDFDFYLPSVDILSQYGFDLIHVTYRPEQTLNLSPMAFEIYQSAVNGIGTQIIYYSRNPIDPDNPQALWLIEGPQAQLVSMLQQSPPAWHNSKLVKIRIDEKEHEVWGVSGGILRESGNNPLIGLFIQMDDTLIYLEGQNIPEQELSKIAESLELVNGNK